jgi:pimeloyl-ACP methyl ester carboxylesterase
MSERVRCLLLPAAGGALGVWEPVAQRLERRGVDAVAVDFAPAPQRGLHDYVASGVAAAEGADRVVIGALSLGGFAAAMLAARLDTQRVILVNAMVPQPGETAGEWWDHVGFSEALRKNDLASGRDPDAPFDVAEHFWNGLDDASVSALETEQAADGNLAFEQPCDFDAWAVPVDVYSGDDDRFFPPEFQRRVAIERLGVVPVLVPGGHVVTVSQADYFADVFERAVAAAVDRDLGVRT